MRIFVKTTDAILPNGLPALVENVSASRISGEKAKEILEDIGRILDGENDSAPYYRIWKDEWCEGESFEIYCQPGKKLRIVKIPPEKP